MNRSNVRIAVFSVGIVSGLLLLLYLPVLIWSPPWGEDGYYMNNTKIIELPSEIYFIFRTNGLNDIRSINKSLVSSSGFNYINTNVYAKPSTHGLIILQDFNRLDSSFEKTSNPFTLWHIKWLEWTAD